MELQRKAQAFLGTGGSAFALLAALLIAALVVPAPAAFARQDSPGVTGVPDPTVRIVHASPDAPPVDVLADGQPIAQGLAFGSATEYAVLSPGDHQIQVVPTGGGTPVFDGTVTLESETASILAVVGVLANIQLQSYQVNTDQIDPGKARLRVIHAVPDAPAVNVGVAGSEEPLVEGVEFPNASDYQDVDAGTYDLAISNADSGEALLSVPGFRIDAGQAYDIFALGQAANQSLQFLPLMTPVSLPCSQTLGTGQPSDACLRIVHASPDAGSIDVYVGEAPIAQGLQFGAASTLAPTANGEQQIRVVPAGGSLDQALVDTTQDLTNGDAFQLTVTGLADDLEATVADLDLRPLPENQARVRVVHASPDLGSVDVAVAGGETPFEEIEFRSQSGYVVFDAGMYTFQAREAGADTLLLEAPDVEIQSGMVYDILVIGQSENGTLQMSVINAAASLLTGQAASPVASTPETSQQTTPAATTTPVVAVGASPVVTTPGAATPAATPTS